MIDDEMEIRNAISRYLQTKGYEVILASTLSEGSKKVSTEEPSLVFLDVNLPDGNGLEQLEKLNEQKPNSQFVVMSAFDHSEARERAMELGAKEFLSKPFSIQQLNLIVQQYA